MPKPGEVYYASANIVGTTVAKERTVMVVSSEKFSNRTNLVHVLNISSTPPAELDVLQPTLVSGKLDPKSRIVTDIVTTMPEKFLRDRQAVVEPSAVAAAIAKVKATFA